MVDATWHSVSQYLHFEVVTLDAASSKRKQQSSLGTVTAPAVDGYRFVLWAAYSTSGWIGACYFENPTNASTAVWCAADKSSNLDGVVKCYALYAKNA